MPLSSEEEECFDDDDLCDGEGDNDLCRWGVGEALLLLLWWDGGGGECSDERGGGDSVAGGDFSGDFEFGGGGGRDDEDEEFDEEPESGDAAGLAGDEDIFSVSHEVIPASQKMINMGLRTRRKTPPLP